MGARWGGIGGVQRCPAAPQPLPAGPPREEKGRAGRGRRRRVEREEEEEGDSN